MLEVGISIVPYADSLERTRELVRAADEGGLALVGIQEELRAGNEQISAEAEHAGRDPASIRRILRHLPASWMMASTRSCSGPSIHLSVRWSC